MAGIKGGKKNGDRSADRCGEGGLGTPPGNLARRLKDFEAMSSGRGAKNTYSAEAFHKPGSNKK